MEIPKLTYPSYTGLSDSTLSSFNFAKSSMLKTLQIKIIRHKVDHWPGCLACWSEGLAKRQISYYAVKWCLNPRAYKQIHIPTVEQEGVVNYDVICRNHSKCPSLNLSQNVCER